MKVSTINRKNTGYFSQQQIDMCYNQSKYIDFLSQEFSIDAFKNQIAQKQKSFSNKARNLLVETIYKQYENIEKTELVDKNIQLLKNQTTFTITTGHQMVAMTGPLYFIYKIAHVIKMCEKLKSVYPHFDFVPIFWMASEDHDYEEIKSFHAFNKTFFWETNQSGPIGRYEMQEWESLKQTIKELFINHQDAEIHAILDNFEGDNYAQAFRKLINQLFGKYGLIIIDADEKELKKSFIPFMKKEILEHFSFHSINDSTEKLIKIGGKQQITPREINLFYIQKGKRERLIQKNDQIEIPTVGTFSKEKIINWIENSPEEFSPNVSLRPLYQEIILPNLCYVGGAGEINYWLQLKAVFDQVEIPFPLLKTRNSIIWIDKNTSEKINSLQLSDLDLFKDLHILQRMFIENNNTEEINFEQIDKTFHLLKENIITNSKTIDNTLDSYINAEITKMNKQLIQIKEKLYKTVKSKHEKQLRNIQQIKDKLFPNNGLQERFTNIIQLSPTGNISPIIEKIVANIQPFNDDFILLTEN